MTMYTKVLIERAIRAGLAAFLATLGAAATQPDLSVSSLKALVIAAGAAAVSAVITVISRAVGDPTSGSFLPGAPGTSEF